MRDPVHKTAQLVRHFLAVSLGNYGALGASFLINIVLTRRLGVDQFGRLALFLMVVQALLLLIGNWTQVGLIRNAAQEFAAERTVARTFWARMAILAPLLGAVALILLAVGTPLATYLEIPAWALALLYGHFLLSLVSSTFGAVLQARQEMRRYGIALFAEKAINLLLVAGLPASLLTDPLAVVVCYAASALLISLWAGTVIGWRAFRPVRFDAAATQGLLRFSLPFTLTSWAGLFATAWLDLVLLKSWQSLSEVGLYALASQLAGVVQQATITFSALLLPHYSTLFMQGEEVRIKDFVQRMLPYWFLAASVVFTGMLLTAGLLVPALFGEAFEGAVPPLALLLVASSALALYNAFDPLLSAYGATWALVKVTLGSVAVKCALAVILIPRFDMTGAALSTVGAYWFSAVGAMALVQSRFSMPILPLALMATPVLVACLGILVFRGRDYHAAAIAGSIVCVGFLVRRFKLFRDEDRGLLNAVRLRAFGAARVEDLKP